jgi:hypothetical protein
MSNIINTSGSVTEVRNRVRQLLSCIPKVQEGMGFQMFYGLRLVSPEGYFFILSMQGSDGHYSSPRSCLSNLAKYREVEVGIIPDERNTGKTKLGTSVNFETGARDSGGKRSLTGRVSHGWLMPSDVGFTRVKDAEYEDVLGYVPMQDLVDDLADFFMRGGMIEGDHEETKEWMRKIKVAGAPYDWNAAPSGGPDDWNYFSFGN